MPIKPKDLFGIQPQLVEDSSMIHREETGADDNSFEGGAVGVSIEIDEKSIGQALEELEICQIPTSNICSEISGTEKHPDLSSALNHEQGRNNLDLSSLGAASFGGNWDNFFSDESVDDLLELAGIIQSFKGLERLSKALEINLAEEAGIPDLGLSEKRVDKIHTILQRIRTESSTEIRSQLLDILLKILYHFEDDFDILCSKKLKLKATIDQLLEIHLYMENDEPMKDVEFQTLMTISEYIERSMFTIEQVQQQFSH